MCSFPFSETLRTHRRPRGTWLCISIPRGAVASIPAAPGSYARAALCTRFLHAHERPHALGAMARPAAAQPLGWGAAVRQGSHPISPAGLRPCALYEVRATRAGGVMRMSNHWPSISSRPLGWVGCCVLGQPPHPLRAYCGLQASPPMMVYTARKEATTIIPSPPPAVRIQVWLV